MLFLTLQNASLAPHRYARFQFMNRRAMRPSDLPIGFFRFLMLHSFPFIDRRARSAVRLDLFLFFFRLFFFSVSLSSVRLAHDLERFVMKKSSPLVLSDSFQDEDEDSSADETKDRREIRFLRRALRRRSRAAFGCLYTGTASQLWLRRRLYSLPPLGVWNHLAPSSEEEELPPDSSSSSLEGGHISLS